MEKIPMTVEGAEALREELDRLKTQERPRIVKAISLAREQGDLRENAEYQYAKEEQGFIEGRILEVENKLSAAQVIDIKQQSNWPCGGSPCEIVLRSQHQRAVLVRRCELEAPVQCGVPFK